MLYVDTDSSNQFAWRSPRASSLYARTAHNGLMPVEASCLDRIPPAQWGRVLDIGIGSGRTTDALSGRCRSYVGVDYSPELIDLAKKNFPDKNLRVMDARMLEFPDREFDVVIFSYNGIDYAGIDDRRQIRAELRRVLKPGGYLYYSTHNLGFRRVVPWMSAFFVEELYTYLRFLRAFIAIPKRMRNFKRQRRTADGYAALVNDGALDFGLLTAYVDPEKERAALIESGFSTELLQGNQQSQARYDESDPWVHVLARRLD